MIDQSSSTAASTSEARAVGEAFPDGTHETASESIPPNPHSDQHMTTPVRENAYLAVWDTSSPTPHSQPFEALDSDVDASDLPVLAYDLDNDPTAETYEIPAYPNYPNDEISEHLSARFVTGHIIGRICKVESDEEPGDAVLNEFFESSAIASEGPGNEVTPSDAFRSAEAPWDWLSAPNYGDLSLEDTVPVTDLRSIMTMDEIINQQPWGPNPDISIDTALLRMTPVFLEPCSPTPAPSFASSPDFHPRPLTIRIPARHARLQSVGASPHSLESKSRRSTSAKTTSSIPAGDCLPSDPVPDSPLTELSASGPTVGGSALTLSIASTSEVANMVDGHGSDSDAPVPRVTSTETTSLQERTGSANAEGPYRNVKLSKPTSCHQC
jgi:hypothetical protein